MPKVSVIGAGHVGATCAVALLKNGVADVVMVDIVDGLAKGKAIDMMQAGAVEGYGLGVVGTTDYAATTNSDVVILTAGLPRQPGMSRTDLLGKNAKILESVLNGVVNVNPDAILVIVTNPLDVMAYLAYKLSGKPANKVIGMGGVLDSARYKYFISQALEVPMSKIDGMVIGSHGDSMVPLTSLTMVNSRSLTGLMDFTQVQDIIQKTKSGGAEIVSYLKTGSAYYAPGASAAKMAELILTDAQAIVPAAVFAQGQYGIDDVYVGLPARIGRNGVEEIVELPISKDEYAALQISTELIKESLNDLIALGY